MLVNIIRLFSIILCSLYIFIKIFRKSNFVVFTKSQFIFLLFILTIISVILNIYYKELTYFIPIITLWFALGYHTGQPQFSFIEVTISFTLSLGMHCLMSFLSTIIMFLVFPNKENFPYIILALLSSLLHLYSVFLLCKIKRLKYGMPFLIQQNLINLATFVCIILAISSIYFTENHHNDLHRSIGLISTIFTLAFLIFWWQAQITKSYRHRLLMRELESLRTSEAEKDALIENLYAENDRLARITHRDNSLITALKDAAVKGLRTDFENPEEMIATREKLIANIEKLAEGRSSTSSAYNKRIPREFDTGLSLLDDLLHHMDKEALEQDIMFSVHFGTLLKDFVPENVSESDLTHTVDDLLKNAFKSTRTCESRAVQLQFYKLGKHLVIEVADNGIPFEVRSLVNMGIEQLTTYEDGSGIGLMDIWSTKENYRATYHLDEYATSSPFSKKISLTFDKKNRYTIRTYRKDEILQMSRRADLQVYDDQE